MNKNDSIMYFSFFFIFRGFVALILFGLIIQSAFDKKRCILKIMSTKIEQKTGDVGGLGNELMRTHRNSLEAVARISGARRLPCPPVPPGGSRWLPVAPGGSR